ncbi:hypothetical protein GCM10009550_65850 [Actinocorallia libanotica]|uniref:DUF4935 domain-containing protein n=2 Tax=Actinocorallia libanotica TaxID=46162 RepID=A0ABN1RVU5_9ACTN
MGAGSWRLRLVVPETVVVETVERFRRDALDTEHEWSQRRERLTKFVDLSSAVDTEVRNELTTCPDRYGVELSGRLKDLGVEVIAPPQISILDMARRAAARLRPYNAKGAGFRDDVIWRTVLELARDNPDQDIVLVSDDGGFRTSGNILHDDLVNSLPAGAGNRVRLAASVSELVLGLAGVKASKDEDRLALVKDKLLRDLIVPEVQDILAGIHVDAVRCGIPGSNDDDTARILMVRGVQDLCLDHTAADEGGIVEFTALADVIFLTGGPDVPERTSHYQHAPWEHPSAIPEGIQVGEAWEEVGEATSAEIMQRVIGQVALDHHGRPTVTTITHLSAEKDGHGDARAATKSALRVARLTRGLLIQESARALADMVGFDPQNPTSEGTQGLKMLLDVLSKISNHDPLLPPSDDTL